MVKVGVAGPRTGRDHLADHVGVIGLNQRGRWRKIHWYLVNVHDRGARHLPNRGCRQNMKWLLIGAAAGRNLHSLWFLIGAAGIRIGAADGLITG